MQDFMQAFKEMTTAWVQQQQEMMVQMQRMHQEQFQSIFQKQRNQIQKQEETMANMKSNTAEPREGRAEGLKMPTYAGDEGESVADFMFAARNFFHAKNLNIDNQD